MRRIFIILVAVVMFFGVFAISSDYIELKTYKQLEYYTLPDGTVRIAGVVGKGDKVTIPEKINGMKISCIADNSVGFTTDENGEKKAITDYIINGYFGSAAYKYANDNNIFFNCLHTLKRSVIKEATYSQKGTADYSCDCGFSEVREEDYKKIPDLALKSATADGDGISLVWNKIDGISKYSIFRSIDGKEYTLVNTVSGEEYFDDRINSGSIKYCIVGTAGKNSGKTDISPITVKYFKSPSFTLDTVKNGILIRWDKVDKAVKYIIYKKNVDGNFEKLFETEDTSYTDEKVEKQSEYTYSVVSVDKNGKESVKLSKGKSLVFGRQSKIVYLTFDDGPSDNTLKILKILKRYDAKATFFVTGNDKVEYMKKIVDAGHTIALHTYSHDYKKIYSSTDAYFNDLNKIHDLVLKKTGVDARVIRFPGGASNTISANYCKGIMSSLTKMVEDRGFKYFDWNVSSGDASADGVAPSKLLSNVRRESSGVDRCVVLMHDTRAKSTTVKALTDICEYYKSKGYEFSGLSTSTLPCHQSVNN